MNYFRLNSECFFVKGEKRSVLYNLIDENMTWLTPEVTEILQHSELNNPIKDKDREIFDILKDNNMGDYAPCKVYIEKLRAFNIFNDKKFHKNTPQLEIITFQLTPDCNLSCDFCNKMYCPVCLSPDKTESHMDFEEWKKIFDKMIYYGMKNAIFTGGEIALYKHLNKCIDYIKSKGIFLTLHTNGIRKINNLNPNSHLVISVFNKSQMNSIINNYKNFDNITLLIYNTCVTDYKLPNKSWKVKECSLHQPKIDKFSFNKTSLYKFYARQNYDNCLKNKLAINYKGDIYPCFQIKESLGNILKDDMSEMVGTLIETYWTQSVDKRDSKCKQCEFRYACDSCNFYDADQNCTYDVRRSVWK